LTNSSVQGRELRITPSGSKWLGKEEEGAFMTLRLLMAGSVLSSLTTNTVPK